MKYDNINFIWLGIMQLYGILIIYVSLSRAWSWLEELHRISAGVSHEQSFDISLDHLASLRYVR